MLQSQAWTDQVYFYPGPVGLPSFIPNSFFAERDSFVLLLIRSLRFADAINFRSHCKYHSHYFALDWVNKLPGTFYCVDTDAFLHAMEIISITSIMDLPSRENPLSKITSSFLSSSRIGPILRLRQEAFPETFSWTNLTFQDSFRRPDAGSLLCSFPDPDLWL